MAAISSSILILAAMGKIPYDGVRLVYVCSAAFSIPMLILSKLAVYEIVQHDYIPSRISSHIGYLFVGGVLASVAGYMSLINSLPSLVFLMFLIGIGVGGYLYAGVFDSVRSMGRDRGRS
jgi:hypothetical protein